MLRGLNRWLEANRWAGIGYGWIGVASACGGAGETMVIDIP
jgi:hypothetical protein